MNKKLLLAVTLLCLVCLAACAPETSPVDKYPYPLPTTEAWLDVPEENVMTDPSTTLTVRTGEKFAVGYDRPDGEYAKIDQAYDDTTVRLVERHFIGQSIPVYIWFLFEAVGSATTTITVNQYTHLSLLLEKQTEYTIIIE